MPVSWLSGLTAAARGAYPHVRRGVRESLSISAIGRAVRSAGQKISNESLSEMVRRERKVSEYVLNFNFLRPDRLPDPRRIPEALTQIQKKYSIEISLSGIHTQTGAPITRNVTIVTDSLLSRNQIDSAVQEISSRKGDRYGFDLIGWEIRGYMKAGPEGTFD